MNHDNAKETMSTADALTNERAAIYSDEGSQLVAETNFIRF